MRHLAFLQHHVSTSQRYETELILCNSAPPMPGMGAAPKMAIGAASGAVIGASIANQQAQASRDEAEQEVEEQTKHLDQLTLAKYDCISSVTRC